MLYVLRRHIWFNHRTNSGERMQFFFIKGYYDQYMGGYFPISQEIKNENQTWYKLKRVTKLYKTIVQNPVLQKKMMHWFTVTNNVYVYKKINTLIPFIDFHQMQQASHFRVDIWKQLIQQMTSTFCTEALFKLWMWAYWAFSLIKATNSLLYLSVNFCRITTPQNCWLNILPVTSAFSLKLYFLFT